MIFWSKLVQLWPLTNPIYLRKLELINKWKMSDSLGFVYFLGNSLQRPTGDIWAFPVWLSFFIMFMFMDGDGRVALMSSY